MVTAYVFFVVENVHVAASPICSQTRMQKATENSCYFYTRGKKSNNTFQILIFLK